jgi:hypothetical protein
MDDISETISTYNFGRGGKHRFSSLKKTWHSDSCSDIDVKAQTGHLTDVVQLVNAERRELHVFHRTTLFPSTVSDTSQTCDSRYQWYWGLNYSKGPTLADLEASLDWVAKKQAEFLVPGLVLVRMGA